MSLPDISNNVLSKYEINLQQKVTHTPYENDFSIDINGIHARMQSSASLSPLSAEDPSLIHMNY